MNPIHRTTDLVIQDYDGEILVYDLASHRAVCLNKISALVWRSCTGVMGPEEIASVISLTEKEECPVEVVDLALEQLENENLLEDQGTHHFISGVSRREAVRKIGLMTVVALPMITAIAAPLAVHAQSTCTPVRQGCNCVSGTCNGNQGNPCTPSTPCASNACRCVCAGNGGTNGDCIV